MQTTIAAPATRDIVVIGASAGGLVGVLEIVRRLPSGFPAALFVVIHTSPDNPGVLPTLLRRVSPLPVGLAEDRQAIERGWIYVARPDHHLLLKRSHIRVTRGPKENGFRPAIDPMFRSAAEAYGPRVIGIVLSGGLNDGTDGLQRITELGGLALAQDPQEATIPSMPLSAIRNVEVHSVLRVADIPGVLQQLVHQIVSDVQASKRTEFRDDAESGELLHQGAPSGTPSAYTCPECGGALWEAPEGGKLLKFRCHIGHGFTAEVLLAEQGSRLEGALWGALRALEENAALLRQQADRQHSAGLTGLAQLYEANATEVEEYASLIRPLLTRTHARGGPPEPEPRAAPAPVADEPENL